MDNSCFNVNNCQIFLQLSDKGVIEKEYLEELLHMNFETGEKDKEYWEDKHNQEIVVIQFMMQLNDKQFISNKILLKIIFGE